MCIHTSLSPLSSSPETVGKTRSTRQGATSCTSHVTVSSRDEAGTAFGGCSRMPVPTGPSSFSNSPYSSSAAYSDAVSSLSGETSSTLVGPPAEAGDAPHTVRASTAATAATLAARCRTLPVHPCIRTPTRPVDSPCGPATSRLSLLVHRPTR
ncbi:hypothetical protein SHIRM173S_11740 [Streptomyces hirsutus]